MTDTTGDLAPADRSAPEASSRKGTARGRRRERWLAPLFWTVLCAAMIYLAVRSFHHSDILAVYSRGGNIQGVLSHRGRLVIALSNLSFGPEKALTADLASDMTEKGETLYEQVYKQWPDRRERFGFGGARSNKGDLVVADASHMAVVVPHWFVAALLAVPAVLTVRRFLRRTGRRRRGACLECGYDLRASGSSGRCPECGSPVLA